VQLGDFLSAPERDPIAARLQYERAVTVDPTNAAGWEALQRLAAEAGDDRRVAECLEQRARNVDAPRQRAAIYVELANVHLGNGAERAARDAFEAAIEADATNEAAAVAMLDAYTREEKWAEAAPLCELLVNAAKRDDDRRALFTRLRLATRIGAALGDPDRAMTSSLAAIDIDPDDSGAQADLVAVCSQCREQPRVIARAKEILTRMAAGPTVLPAGVLVALAQIQRDAGEIDAAASTLEHALQADPENTDVLKELSDVYLAQGDFPRCCKLKVDLARNALTADARFQLLCDAGEIWARRADELDKAATVFEEARVIKPLDHWLLHTLLWLYGERHRWEDLSSVLESIAQIQESPEKKAKSFFAMAQVVLEKVGDPIRAAQLFDQVLDIDKKRLDAFEQLVRALTEAKDWDFLERSYRKMIARTKDDPEPNANLQFALFHQLGLIYRDRLEDAEHAYESLEAAARLRPDDTAVRKIVTELLIVTDNLDSAVARTREMIERDPHDAELYSELYELFLRQHFFDKAWCAVNVLAQMREPSPEQRRFHEDYAPMPLSQVPGQLVEQAWRSHVLHADLDPTLTTLFSRMTPAVARMRYAQLRPDQLVYAAGRPFTHSHSRLYEAIRVTFANAAEILHMSPPELLLGDPSSLVPFAPALAPFGAIHVGVPAVEARAEALVYVVGKRLAEQRPELIARAFFPAVSDLTGLLAAAVRVSRQEGAKDAAGAALDASLNAVLMPQERDGIRAVLNQAAMVGLVDVKRWSQAADLSSMRAGLLLCGDVGPARKTILAEPQSTADLPPREKVGELYKFATSDLYSDLRGAIGVAVQE
jgi:tetratricopeptide (TPR) repeat protein